METFANSAVQLFSTHEALFSFKMSEALTAAPLHLPLFHHHQQLEQLKSTSEELTALGESLLDVYHPKTLLYPHQKKIRAERKVSDKKFQEILHFSRFLKENIPPSVGLIDVGSGVGHLITHLNKYGSYRSLTAIEQKTAYLSKYPKEVTLLNMKLEEESQLSFIKNGGQGSAALIGLHSCGDLTPNCLRFYLNKDKEELSHFSVVSCCYHKMSGGNLRPMSELFGGLDTYSIGFLRLACQRRGDSYFPNGVQKEVDFLLKNKKKDVDEDTRGKLGALLKSHSYLQRLAELVVLLDRKAFLFENNEKNVFLYSKVIPESMRLNPSLLNSLKHLLLSMPTDRPHLKTLKAVRKMKEVPKYPPGIISLQVLGNSLYLFTDQSRYLFNCGEGTQRLAHEHKFKLAKLDHVFLTSNRWERVGGLPGVALTVQDIGVGEVWVHGPPGVDRLFTTTRRFVILKDLTIKTVNTLKSSSYSDHILTINYINIDPTPEDPNNLLSPSSQQSDPTDYYKSYRDKHGQKMASVASDCEDETEKKFLKKDVAVCYGIQLCKKEGQLLIDKCVERGVPPGPLLGKLKNGEDVVLPDGRVVKSKDVRVGDCEGQIVLVLDCPTLSHLPHLLTNPSFKPYQGESTSTTFTHTVVHFTPLSILKLEEYQEFMRNFNISTRHLIINEGTLRDAYEAVHRMQTKLNVIDNEIFPLLPIKEEVKLECKEVSGCIVGQTGMKVELRPTSNITDPIWKITHSQYQAELKENQDFMQELSKFKESQSKHPTQSSSSSIVFLGTGSSIPNKTRNVSSILFNIDQENSMLLDCGEGTLSQLTRFEKSQEILSKLKCIYISHLHADHHLGLFSLLKLEKKVIVIAPKQIRSWVENYSKDFESLNFELVDADSFLNGSTDSGLLESLGLKSINTCFVKHCPNAFGISLVTKEGKKLTYSGDTMPCNELIVMGQDSDLLIHEATMEDGMEDEAVAKMHSTVGQAIEIGEKMGAKFTILTHFSQRYSKIPFIESLNENVGVAFDNMVVDLGNMGKICGMHSVLSEGWKEDVEEMEERKFKRVRRKEIMSS